MSRNFFLFFSGAFSLLLFLCFHPGTMAQNTEPKSSVPDSVMEKMHSPTKATLMSTFLPGLGQAYNKKYWKIPIIYAGFGIMTYFIVTNTNEYINYKCAYIEKENGDTAGSYADLVNKYTASDLLSAREYYRRNTEISILVTTLWYILNIVDAAVDAHLFTYNLSQDLSLRIEPALLNQAYSKNFNAGIRLSFHF
jgi:hypothetical protein